MTRTSRRRRVLRRLLIPAAVVVVALLAATGVAVGVLAHNLDRVDGVFDDLADRPQKMSPGALDVLVVSTDLVSVLHVSEDRSRTTMIWLPPQTEPTVAAVERLTGVRIDHYVRFDWSVLGELEPTAGPFWPPYEPSPDPAVDEQRQEDYLRMVVGGNVHQEMAKNPVMLYRFLHTVSSHLTLDRGWSTWDLAQLLVSMRSVRSWDFHYLTAPTGAAAARFWEEVRYDRTGSLRPAEPAGDDASGSP